MGYPTYLIHFNPNHDPKTGRFTYNKYIDKSGRLNNEGRKEFGVDDALKERTLKKAVKVMSRKLAGLNNNLFWKESELQLENDIHNASNNKAFMKDFENEIKKSVEAVEKAKKDSDEYMDKFLSSPKGTAYDPPKDEYDVTDERIEETKKVLSNKYPEYKNLLDIYYDIPSADWYNKGWSTYNDDEKIRELLDPDGFYDERIIDKNQAKISEIKDAIKNEYVSSFIDKYGQYDVDKAMRSINIAATGESWFW